MFSTILMISVNDGVCHGFPQRDFNVAHPFRNTAAIPEREHEFVHERRNRSYFAWQGALQSDARAPVIMRYRHSEITITQRSAVQLRPWPLTTAENAVCDHGCGGWIWCSDFWVVSSGNSDLPNSGNSGTPNNHKKD